MTHPHHKQEERTEGPEPNSRQERIAELEREIADWEKEALAANKDGDAYIAEETLTLFRAELSRLCNEQPNGGDEACPHCGTFGWGSDHAIDCPANPVPGYGTGTLAELAAPSPATSPGAQDVRGLLSQTRPYIEGSYLFHACSAYPETAAPHKELLDAIDAALAQSDAQPAGWQYRWKRSAQTWSEWSIEWNKDVAASYARHCDYEVRPLYTAPPRHDASAGLVKAAELLVSAWDVSCHGWNYMQLTQARELALRTRAADRSAPRSDKGGA